MDTSPAATKVSARIDVMLSKIESELLKYESDLTSKPSKIPLLKPTAYGDVSTADLEAVLKVMRDHPVRNF
jgi:hypothetical protein